MQLAVFLFISLSTSFTLSRSYKVVSTIERWRTPMEEMREFILSEHKDSLDRQIRNPVYAH